MIRIAWLWFTMKFEKAIDRTPCDWLIWIVSRPTWLADKFRTHM